jgi:hypothetical protein
MLLQQTRPPSTQGVQGCWRASRPSLSRGSTGAGAAMTVAKSAARTKLVNCMMEVFMVLFLLRSVSVYQFGSVILGHWLTECFWKNGR